MGKQYLFGLQSNEYEHPLDRKVLGVLKSLPKFDDVVNFFLNWGYIKWQLVALKGSCFQITEGSCKELYNQILDVQKTLDVYPMPSLYTEWHYEINGYTTGYKDNTLMVLKSGAVDLLEENELKYVIGHEFGHIKSGHVIYHVMAQFINEALGEIPIVGSFTEPIALWLKYWDRMSEFTSDRAGLLACQDIDAALNAIVKMAGLPKRYYGENLRDSFIKQAESFSIDLNTISEKTIKLISIATSSHPWTVVRAVELIKWYESGEYDRIINEHKSKKCIWPDCALPMPESNEVCPHCSRPQNL